MAAGKPVGTLPERFGVNPDVDKAPSEPEEKAQEEKVKASESKEAEDKTPALDEEDLKTIEGLKNVPYTRFKEVNEKVKTLRSQLKELDERRADDIRRAVEDAELRTRSRLEESKGDKELDSLDPYERKSRELEREMKSLRGELADVRGKSESHRLQTELSRLEQKYPKADSLAVLGWAKLNASADLEELMEKSHSRNVDLVEKEIRNILDQKRSKAKTAIPTRESGIKIKDEERPKTVKEANILFKKLFRNAS